MKYLPPLIKKPVLGLMPRFIDSEPRIYQINEAIKRYLDAEEMIPEEWLIERNEIIAYNKRRK